MGTRVTSKGQVTIPKRVRDALGIVPGSEVEFVVQEGRPDRAVMRRAGGASKGRFDHLVGTIDLGMTTDEYMEMMRGPYEE